MRNTSGRSGWSRIRHAKDLCRLTRGWLLLVDVDIPRHVKVTVRGSDACRLLVGCLADLAWWCHVCSHSSMYLYRSAATIMKYYIVSRTVKVYIKASRLGQLHVANRLNEAHLPRCIRSSSAKPDHAREHLRMHTCRHVRTMHCNAWPQSHAPFTLQTPKRSETHAGTL